jgi:pentatricopeptide repeat protein
MRLHNYVFAIVVAAISHVWTILVNIPIVVDAFVSPSSLMNPTRTILPRRLLKAAWLRSSRSSTVNQEMKTKRLQDKLARQFDKLSKSISLGEIPTRKSFELLLATCASANDWTKYNFILDKMKNYSYILNEETFGKVISECYSTGNGAAAMKILKDMEDLQLTPNKSDLEKTILALCRNDRYESGLWKKALQLLYLSSSGVDRGLISSPLNVEVYNEVLGCMESAKRSDDSMSLLHLMEEQNDIHPLPTLATYQRVLSSLVADGKIEIAVDLLLSLPQRGTYPTIYSYEIVMSELLRKGRKNYWRKALELLKAMQKQKIAAPTVMYNRVISCCAKSNQPNAAKSVFQMMKQSSVVPDTVTFNALINSCANNGDAKEALALFHQATLESEVDVITYTNTIKACAKAKWSRKAIQLLEDAKQKKNITLDAYIYTAVIDACAKAKLWQDAVILLDDMKKNKIIPNEYSYSSVISACGNCGNWEKALELFDQMKTEDLKVSAVGYNAVISALARGARFQLEQPMNRSENTTIDISNKAMELFEEMKSDKIWPDIYTYSSIMSSLASSGKYQEALDLIQAMRNGPLRARPNKITYTAAISACARAGAYKDAMRLFEEMKTDGIAPDLVAYNSLMSAYSQGNQPDQVFDLWNEMCSMKEKGMDTSPDIITLTSAIACLDRSGSTDDIQKMDLVFHNAVKLNVVFPPSSMDTTWEKDLSGLSLPVARAACRYILHSLDKTNEIQDLMLITGVGKSHQYPEATTTLREHVRQVLLDDFHMETPSVLSGVVCVQANTIKQWLQSCT